MKTTPIQIAMLIALASPAALAAATPASEPLLTTAGDDEPTEKEQALYGDPALVPAQIEAAVARAKAENKRVLVQWGGEWCSWCHLLHKAWASDRELSRKLLYEYEVLYANIGQWDHNMELAAELGAELRGNGVPYLTVLDGDGKPLANQTTGGFEVEGEEIRHDTDRLLEFLTDHQADAWDAKELLAEALDDAKRSERRVLLTFGAPWCGWCHRFEDWLAREDVAAGLAADFVVAKIDVDRTIGGNEVRASLGGVEGTGIPWFVILDAAGEPLADSGGPGDNLGCPWSVEEKASFVTLLAGTTKHLAPAELQALVAHLNPGPSEEQEHAEGERVEGH